MFEQFSLLFLTSFVFVQGAPTAAHTAPLIVLRQTGRIRFDLTFPLAQYRDFALAENSDILDPAKAAPNIHETGPVHLRIIKNDNGYSEVSLPLHGIHLKVPFGWGSQGGFATMERIDFFPASTQADLIRTLTHPSPVNFGIKVLDSSGLPSSDFKGVMGFVQSITQPETKEKIVTEVDESHHAFLVHVGTIDKADFGSPESNASLYLQNPNPHTRTWVNMDIRAPRKEFQKYLGLLGLIYKDIVIDWPKVEASVASVQGG